jgi:hypothetical protein
MALTNAERQRQYRRRMKDRGLKRDWLPESKTIFSTAAAAKERLEKYLNKKLKDENDLSVWEFYTWLLSQAKKHPVDISGYTCIQYQDDKKKTLAVFKKSRVSKR